MIDRDVEEPLELVLVEIQSQHAIRPRGGDQVGHELGADRHARLVLAVLPGVPEIRDHRRDARGTGPLGGVDQDQQLHQVLRRRVGGLDDEHILPPHVLIDLREDLTVRKPPQSDPAKRLAQLVRHLLRQRTVRRPGHKEHAAAGE